MRNVVTGLMMATEIIRFLGVMGQTIDPNMKVDSLLVQSAYGLCYQCLYQNDTAIYLPTKPKCTVTVGGINITPP
jgi:hypothetical protein